MTNITKRESKIILIRHGEPEVAIKKFYSRNEMLLYDEEYLNSNIKGFKKSPLEEVQVKKVYHSPLRRAEHTAQLLFPKSELIADERFKEFERGVAYNLPLKLPLKLWKIISRGMWFLGFSKKAESFRKARKRVKANAEFLQNKALEEGTVVVVAHGFHNRFLTYYLKKIGWEISYSSGYGFLGVQILKQRL